MLSSSENDQKKKCLLLEYSILMAMSVRLATSVMVVSKWSESLDAFLESLSEWPVLSYVRAYIVESTFLFNMVPQLWTL